MAAASIRRPLPGSPSMNSGSGLLAAVGSASRSPRAAALTPTMVGEPSRSRHASSRTSSGRPAEAARTRPPSMSTPMST